MPRASVRVAELYEEGVFVPQVDGKDVSKGSWSYEYAKKLAESAAASASLKAVEDNKEMLTVLRTVANWLCGGPEIENYGESELRKLVRETIQKVEGV